MDAKKVKTVGARMGEIFAVICALCFCALVVAATIKLIMWMF